MSRSRLAEPQRNRIRHALEAYRQQRGRGGRAAYWRDVDDELLRTTGLDVSHDTLRQWAVGYRDKKGRHHKRWPEDNPEHEQALIDFVLAKGLLTPEDLEGTTSSIQPALPLLEYLDLAADTGRIPAPPGLAGVYVSEPVQDLETSHVALTELTFERPGAHGFLRATAITERFPAEVLEKGGPPAHPARRARLRQWRDQYDGWAILTPEDNLLLFLKHTGSGANRYYLTLGSDLSHDPATPATRLVLLEHEYPIEPDEHPEPFAPDLIRERLLGAIRVFVRDTTLEGKPDR